MELSEILHFLKDLPIWSWVILFLIYASIFGDRTLWEYEVKFPMEPGIGRGEVELECFKKKGTKIEVTLELEPAYQQKQIEILRKGLLIYTIKPNKNSGKRIFIKRSTTLEKPEEGDEIVVKIDGENIFSGQLVLD